jgi:hypothetical protein
MGKRLATPPRPTTSEESRYEDKLRRFAASGQIRHLCRRPATAAIFSRPSSSSPCSLLTSLAELRRQLRICRGTWIVTTTRREKKSGGPPRPQLVWATSSTAIG